MSCLISPNRDFIFVHNKKTAGTSMTKVLVAHGWEMQDAHVSAKIYRRTCPDAFLFGFTRNPWDRLFSYYKHMVRERSMELTFSQWLQRCHGIERQSAMFCDRPNHNRSNEILLDFLGYYETLQEDWATLQQVLGIDDALPLTNNDTTGNSYLTAYTDRDLKLVRKVLEREAEVFGYNFDGITKRVIL